MAAGACELCERETFLTRHHLVPQCRHKANSTKRRFTREAVQRDLLLMLCSACHRQVHALVSEKELARDYHTAALLRTHPGVSRFVAWIRRKPPGFRPQVSASRSKVSL